jgi:hypothetical protein
MLCAMNRVRSCVMGLLFASLSGCASTPARTDNESYVRGEETVALTTIVFSGHRYVADADLGLGKPVPLMVHGNARMFLMVTHEIGERLTGGPVRKVADYGYSAKGKGVIRVPLLRFGAMRITNIADVPVFDYVPDGRSPVQGMVGVPFLVAERAAVDFSRDVMILGVKRSASPNRRLLDRGYRHVAMATDPNGRMIVPAYFPSLGRTLSITPSTVSNALTLHRPAFVGTISMTKDTTDTDHSPSGTSPELFHADRVSFEIAGTSFTTAASFEDFAEYANIPEPELGSLGLLGFDWMKEHEAIIDYANDILYFRP